MQSPELLAKIAGWRNKQREGTMTPDDWREAMLVLRSARTGAQAARAASKKAPVDVGALKDSLRGLRKA